MNHKGTKILETKNLILRRFKLVDAKAMYNNWASDLDVIKFLTWNTHGSIEVSKNVITSWINEYKNEKFYQWAIVVKSNGDEPVGSISVVQQDERIGLVHVGHCIGKRWWNKGVTSEALTALIKYFFEEIQANRIESRHDPLNENLGKVMMKCGMKYEGTMRKADINNQGICDYFIYAVLLEDYINK